MLAWSIWASSSRTLALALHNTSTYIHTASTLYEMLFFISAWHSAYTKTNHTPIAYFRNFIHIYFTWLSTFLKISLKYAATVFYRCKLYLCKYLCSGHSTALSFLQSHCSQSHCNLLFHSDLSLFFRLISFNYV